MPYLVIRWLVTTLAVLLVAGLLPGVKVDGIPTAIAAAAVLSVLNLLVRPILVFLTLPLTLFTLGFFLLVLNALMFQLAAAIVPGLHIEGFGSAFLGALIVSIVSWLTSFRGPRGRIVFVRTPPRPNPPTGHRQVGEIGTVDLDRDEKGDWK